MGKTYDPKLDKEEKELITNTVKTSQAKEEKVKKVN